MENKLFYQDPYIQTFTTNLKNQEQDETGKWYVVLEQTAFYPTGGGQPFDTGTLNDIPVVDVEQINGEIRHYVSSPVVPKENLITGTINWERRFDHMQQHAGQHILSAAFEELFNYQTVSFHLGQEVLTIDLDIEDLSDNEAFEVEKRANQIILENRSIETKWISNTEISQYPFRKQPSVTENIRLVIIPEFDYNGCGGTHPNSTGQVGAIKILDWERQRKKIRIQFVCGNRVLKQLQRKQKIIQELTMLLNSPEEGMVESLTRLLENAKSIDKQLDDVRQANLYYEAKDIINEKIIINNRTVICKVLPNRSMKELQKLARTISNESSDVIVLLITENELQLQIVAAKSASVEGSMNNWLAELLPKINGKGGGNDTFAQGGGEAVMTGKQFLDNALSIIHSL